MLLSLASLHISLMSLTAPTAFEIWLMAIILVFLFIFSWMFSRVKSSFTFITKNLKPLSLQSCCQGTKLLWCSSSDTKTSSPFDKPWVKE